MPVQTQETSLNDSKISAGIMSGFYFFFIFPAFFNVIIDKIITIP